MKVTKKTMLLAGTPLFEDPAIGLKINSIRPAGGKKFTLGGEARMKGENLRFVSAGSGGFLMLDGAVTAEGRVQSFNCEPSFATDGKSATLRFGDVQQPIPAGEYSATLNFFTGDAESAYSKDFHLPITLVIE